MEPLSNSPDATPLQVKLAALGHLLQDSLQAVMVALPQKAQRTGGLSTYVGVNKVFTSRLLTALRQEDPLHVVHRMPGPEPLGRFLQSPALQELPKPVLRAANDCVARFQAFIEAEAGDRAALQTMMSPWLGEARSEFDQRRRQAAFKAISELKGAAVDLSVATAIVHPAEDRDLLDVVWMLGLIGLRRLRPDARVKLDTRRLSHASQERHPTTLDGNPLGGPEPSGLEEFCPNGPTPLEVVGANDTVNYLLAGHQFGPRHCSDMLLAEVNRAEIKRHTPEQPNRRNYVNAVAVPPAQTLILDLFLHRSLLDDSPPELLIYDTAGSGPVDPNTELSTYDMLESAEQLAFYDGADGIPAIAEYAQYGALMARVLGKLDWSADDFHLWRVRVPYPLYSSQVTIAFKPQK